ncbi:hypothetical protein BVRB_7g174530 [Beta vulgaris subsp. vulgaris]|nr:hypothetical protein BVRB_7g174530 [Beta vulgaris subsp. vulgaris]
MASWQQSTAFGPLPFHPTQSQYDPNQICLLCAVSSFVSPIEILSKF